MAANGDAIASDGDAIDSALWRWAQKALGDDFTVDDVDASHVSVAPGPLSYGGPGDWYRVKVVEPEVFDNERDEPAACSYRRTGRFRSSATWRLTTALDSRILPRAPLALAFPADGYRNRAVAVTLDDVTADGAERTAAETDAYDVCKAIDVAPYAAVEADIRLRTCRLDEVTFKADLVYSGELIARGHPTRKAKAKTEVKVGVASALRDVPGFRPVEGLPRQEVKVAYTLEGVCSGECLVSVTPHFTNIRSLV